MVSLNCHIKNVEFSCHTFLLLGIRDLHHCHKEQFICKATLINTATINCSKYCYLLYKHAKITQEMFSLCPKFVWSRSFPLHVCVTKIIMFKKKLCTRVGENVQVGNRTIKIFRPSRL